MKTTVVENIGAKLLRLRYPIFSSLILFIVAVKVGLHPIGSLWIDSLHAAANAFPNSVSYLSTSLGPLFIGRWLSSSHLLWWGIHGLLLAFWIYLALRKIQRSFPDEKYLIALVFLASPIMICQLLLIGHYDLYTVAGASIAVFAEKSIVRYLGILLAVSANPDQGLVTAVLLVLIAFGSKTRESKHLAIGYGVIGIIIYSFAHVITHNPSASNREAIIASQFKDVVKNSLGVWTITPLTVIGLTGFAWILIAPTVLSRREVIFHSLAVFVIPVIASLVILDGTRVGVAIGAAATFSSWKRILDLRKVRKERLEPEQLQIYVGIGFLLLLLTPLLYMDIGAQLRLPYRKLIGLLH